MARLVPPPADLPAGSLHLLTARQVAARLDVSTVTVHKLRQQGALPSGWSPLGFLFQPEIVEQLRRERLAAQRRLRTARAQASRA
jgi:hypothetical protein